MTSALCVLLLTPSNKLLINRLENPTTYFHHSDQGEERAQGEHLEEKNAEQAQVLHSCTVRPGKIQKPRNPERAWFLGGMQ